MKRQKVIVFRASCEEQRWIGEISAKLNRSKSDTLRLLVRAGYEVIQKKSKEAINANSDHPAGA